MPVTTGYSSEQEKSYSDKTSINTTPFTSQDLRASSGSHSSPNGSISSYSRTNSVDSLDDSQSTSSGGSISGHSRQVSNDSTTGSGDYIPTRSIKQACKPQHNALQFVKIASCPLYKKATEQMKKAEEVKKLKNVTKQDEEDWQHNLDNWKSKRRLSCQKSQERADELRRLEEEEFIQERPRRKSKTFSEMVEERSRRGRNFGYFSDEWDDTDSVTKPGSWDGSDSPRHDLSIDSTGSDTIFRDDESSDTSSIDRNIPETSELKTKENGMKFEQNGKTEEQAHKSPVNGCGNEETDENNANPFEKAIQSYVQFAESQKKTLNNDKRAVNGSHSHKPKKVIDDSCDTVSKTILEENGSSTEEKANKATFSGDRSGGEELNLVVILKSGNDRDFGFSTKGQGRGLVFVETVLPRGSADTAGLKVGDEVLAINGESVSNRTHSAIVFAIKQALYTGRLELGIYRYVNANQIPKQSLGNAPQKKPSRIEEKKAVFSRDNSTEKDPSPEKRILREKSPKIDIVKRRSLFESPPKEFDVQQQRRSLDASSTLKNKIQSFENLENIDKMAKPSEGKRAKQKTLSEKQNGVDRKSDFMKRLTSFENLESIGNGNGDIVRFSPERKQSLKDKIDVFEKPEKFERSRSCDFLNADSKHERPLISPINDPINDAHIQSPQEETDGENSYDWDSVDTDNYSEDPIGPPRIIDVVTKEDSPEPANESTHSQPPLKLVDLVPVPLTKQKQEEARENTSSNSGEPVVEQKVLEVMTKTTMAPSETDEVESSVLLNSNNSPPLQYPPPIPLSPFALADMLDETPLVGSRSSSPEWNPTPDPLKTNSSKEEVDNATLASMENETDMLDMSHLGEELYIVDDFDFDAPPRVSEPPKEKPPPPPVENDLSFDQVDAKAVQLKRVDSTKRIKKELQRLRSDFLGFDSVSDADGFDSNYLNLDTPAMPGDDNVNLNKTDKSEPTAKENYVSWNEDVHPVNGTETITDEVFYPESDNRIIEDDEIARKEKEIIEDLEREERMKNSLMYKAIEEPPAVSNDDKLTSQKNDLEDEKRRQEEERRLREREEQLRQQEEALRLEKEKLRKEQEELMRQREEYQRQIQEHQLMYPPFVPPTTNSKPVAMPHSSQEEMPSNEFVDYPATNLPIETRFRMTKKDAKMNSCSPPLVSPTVENKMVEEPLFSKSVQPLPETQLGFPDDNPPPRKPPETNNTGIGKLSSQTSVPPKSKLTNNNEKCPVRRKPEPHTRNSSSYNQHWLIQEAEMRRISEQQDRLRQARSPTRELPNEGKQFSERTKSSANPSYSQRPPTTQNNFYGKPMNYNSHMGQIKRPSQEQFSTRSPDYVEVQTTNPLLTSKNSNVQNPLGPLANGDPHMLSVSGKKKCSHCGDELGKGAAMIIESLHLFYHIHCFKCCVCHVQLGNGLSGADVRVRNQKLHCHNCYSNDEAGLKFSKV